MTKAIIFDLDGTLVRTENLKAHSYARAVAAWQPSVNEEAVINAYKSVVGLSRNEVSVYLFREFHLEGPARGTIEKYKVDTPWKAFSAERVAIYEQMLETPGLLAQHKCPHNIALLEYARREGFLVGLATMSYSQQTLHVLTILGLDNMFDEIATRDDVEKGKPDPEIYSLVGRRLDVRPQEALVIEDSVNGVKAALAAGMSCIAVTSDITRQEVHGSRLIDKQWIVDEPALLMTIVRQRIAETRLAGLVSRQSFSGYQSPG